MFRHPALADHRCWVFDMDGTLTRPMHDFDAIRRELGLPEGRPILEALDDLPPDDAAERHARLDRIEWDIAQHAEAQAGAAELLERLATRGARLGVVTRNDHAIALATLEAAGIGRWFEAGDVVGRHEAAPKPAPEGVLALLDGWSAEPEDTVVVGDFLFDLLAGRAAGATTVYLDTSGAFPHRAHADVLVTSLLDLVPAATH